MVHWLIVIGPAPISRELSSIGAGSALRYEILDTGLDWAFWPRGRATLWLTNMKSIAYWRFMLAFWLT